MYGGHRVVVGDGGSTLEAGVVTVIQLAISISIGWGVERLTDTVSPDDRSSYAARIDARNGNPRAVV